MGIGPPCAPRWGGFIRDRTGLEELEIKMAVQSETIIQLPHNSHPPMIIPRREFSYSETRVFMLKYSVTDPSFLVIIFFFVNGRSFTNGLSQKRLGMNGTFPL